MRRYLTITPFFVLSLGLFLYAIFALGIEIFDANAEGWGLLLAILYGAIAMGVGLIDFLLKRFVFSYRKLFISQIAVLIMIGLFTLLSEVKQTFQLPEDYDKTYATVIFDVEGEKSLPHRLMPFHSPIQINANGYILTSSTVPDYAFDYTQLEIIDSNEKKLGSDDSDYSFIPFEVHNFEHEGKKYNYLTVKIEPRKDCCGWSAAEVNKNHKAVVQYFKTIKNK